MESGAFEISIAKIPHGYQHWGRHQVVHTVGEKLQKAERGPVPPLSARASKLHHGDKR